MKPIVRSDLLNRVHFHSPKMNYEKFYKEYLPRSCLPAEYGGHLQTSMELHKIHRQSLVEMREYFLFEERVMNFELEEYDFDAEDDDNDVPLNTRM